LAPIGDIKCITGSDIAPYHIKSGNFIPTNVFKEFKKNMDIFLPNRILVRETGDRFVATLESEGIITTRSLYNVCLVNNSYSPSFILGILCSKLFRFYFRQFIMPETKTFPKIRIAQLKKIPIAEMISEQHINIQFHISNLANNLMSLNNQFNETKLEIQRQQIQRTIDHTKKKIDELVYELYGLTEKEIAIIEQN
ncbi:MAG: TaqI-like C-terminal specificity domain-containing protein, partial [Nitrosopumilus sp.]